MRTTNRQIAAAVVADLNKGKSQASVSKALAAYLVGERRSKDTDAIMREVARLQFVDNGQLEIDVISATKLTDASRKQISDLFLGKAKKLVMNETIDPTVIGGVKVESSTSRLDLTIHRRLQRLKEMGATN